MLYINISDIFKIILWLLGGAKNNMSNYENTKIFSVTEYGNANSI